MVVGGFLGIGNEATLVIEKVIAFSVLSIGLLIIFKNRLNIGIILGLLVVFGFFHGYAHGAEMPETNTVYKYIPGYTMGAALIALLGAFIGKRVTASKEVSSYTYVIGGILIGCGVMLLLP